MRKKKKIQIPENRIFVQAADYDSLPDLCIGAEAAAIIGAGITAAGGAASAAINAGAKWGSSTYMRVAKEMADYNQQIAMKNWRLENEYNSPKSQMQRYQEAGLNPNLIYGQQNTGGSIPQTQVSTNPADYEGSHHKSEAIAGAIANVSNILSNYQQLRYQNVQISQAEAAEAAQRAKAVLDNVRAEGQAIDNATKESMNNYKLDLLNKKNAIAQITLENKTQYEAEMYKQRLEKAKVDLKNAGLKGQALDAEVKKLDKMIEYYDQQIEESKVRASVSQGMLAIQAGQAAAQNQYYNALTGKTDAETRGLFASQNREAEKHQEWVKFAPVRAAAAAQGVFEATGKFVPGYDDTYSKLWMLGNNLYGKYTGVTKQALGFLK